MSTQVFEDIWDQFKFELMVILLLSVVVIFLPAITAFFTGGPTTRKAVANSPNQTNAEARVQHAHTSQGDNHATHAPAGTEGSWPHAAWPMTGHVTAEFGIHHMPWQHRHSGIDISSGQRSGITPVRAFSAGTVTQTVRASQGFGNYVVIDHGNNVASYYAHLSLIRVQQGQTVKTGDVIGTEGNTGASTGTHLHFEIRVNGTPMNPRQFIGGNP